MSAAARLQGRRVMVVEDDYLIARGLIAMLEDAGAEVIGPFGWVAEAIAYIESGSMKLDFAVLDVNLHGEKSYSIADALAAREVSFVFATGYGADAVDAAYRRHPRCEKPFDQHALIEALGGEGDSALR